MPCIHHQPINVVCVLQAASPEEHVVIGKGHGFPGVVEGVGALELINLFVWFLAGEGALDLREVIIILL